MSFVYYKSVTRPIQFIKEGDEMKEIMKTIMFICAIGNVILLLINAFVYMIRGNVVDASIILLLAFLAFGLAMAWYYAIKNEKE